MKIVTGSKVSDATSRGFVPRNMGASGDMAAIFGTPGMDANTWKSIVSMNKSSDWGLCSDCSVELENHTGTSGKCFIATAAYGTEQAEDVVQLRNYRDTVLRQTKFGRMFIAIYEVTSPPLARLIFRSKLARSLVRSLIVRPARRLADYSTNLGNEIKEEKETS
jgi:hypothetical protein